MLDLLEGKTEILEEYVEFISNSAEEELLPGLITILESSLKYNYSVDWILSDLKNNVNDIEEYVTNVDIRYYEEYIYLLVMYYYEQENMYEAINTILETLIFSIKIENDTNLKKSVALFELLREHAHQSQLQMFHNIMENIIVKEFTNEKENVLAYSRSLN
ncbi:hypothetical protein [Paenibacillus sp. FSL R10-2734]|uniref:hypothetical protein n=1 Tax=Paenibacillus sp. FSL R10-2734 TaxID=2954691 RepID=UPI0030D88449